MSTLSCTYHSCLGLKDRRAEISPLSAIVQYVGNLSLLGGTCPDLTIFPKIAQPDLLQSNLGPHKSCRVSGKHTSKFPVRVPPGTSTPCWVSESRIHGSLPGMRMLCNMHIII
jgi:hypothetical protein